MLPGLTIRTKNGPVDCDVGCVYAESLHGEAAIHIDATNPKDIDSLIVLDFDKPSWEAFKAYVDAFFLSLEKE